MPDNLQTKKTGVAHFKSAFGWSMMGSVLLVLIVELLNSSVEAAIDRIGLERHELSGRSKDLGSAAVFTALILVVCVWGVILIDRLF
jgi:diacylglycerol kinase (ATP)